VPLELCTGEGGRLVIGRQCSLNYGVSIGATGSIRIGDRSRLGPYVMVVDTDFHDPLKRGHRPPPRPVTIGDDVWIGAKASILPGVTIGRGAIVGTGAVVTKDVPEFAVVAGVPARVLHVLDREQFEPEKDYL
jgi:maltose O-acetyltransferase